MPRLDGKTALITGATGGIGEATAALFLNEGANVMLLGRSADKLAATHERLGSTDQLRHFVADATDESATSAAVRATVDAFGGLDVLFANAGTAGDSKSFDEVSQEEFESVLRPNVTGVWLAMKHAIGPMRERGGGSIIATASTFGAVGFSGLAAYAASKHAVCGLVKTVALELAPSGIRANAVLPGPIDNILTRSVAETVSPHDPSALITTLEGLVPASRLGSNEEVANLVLFLASDESSYCTGGLYPVDGGWTAA